MLIDLEQAPAELVTHSDVCVIGAGIAGLVLSERLANRGFRVHLLEAGGLDFEERSQQIYDAEMAAQRHAGTTEGRFRLLGGSSTRWGGQLLPYTHDIYAAPAGSPSASWPVDDSTLTPYYREVQTLTGVNLLPFDERLLRAMGRTPIDVGPDLRLRFSKWIPFARRNFARTIGERLKSSSNTTIYTHANVAALEGDGTRITAARVRNYAGREFYFTADSFIVATGTIESSRLLLMSPGVPNAHDQLGRYFHDHVSFHAGEFTGDARTRLLERLGPFLTGGTLHTCKLEATAAMRARERLLAVMAHVTIEEPEDSGVAAVRNLLRSLQRGRLGEAVGSNLLPMLRGLGDVTRLLWYARFKQQRAVSQRATVRLNIDLEQPANPLNRVRLSETRDPLGWRKAIVDWRVGPAEQDTATRFARALKPQLEQLGLAPSHWAEGLAHGELPLVDTYHPMGGLRMGSDARDSVVDPALRVHGVSNLYVASCAVYPAGGSSNPTFTLIALSMRLADSLARSKPPTHHGQFFRSEAVVLDRRDV